MRLQGRTDAATRRLRPRRSHLHPHEPVDRKTKGLGAANPPARFLARPCRPTCCLRGRIHGQGVDGRGAGRRSGRRGTIAMPRSAAVEPYKSCWSTDFSASQCKVRGSQRRTRMASGAACTAGAQCNAAHGDGPCGAAVPAARGQPPEREQHAGFWTRPRLRAAHQLLPHRVGRVALSLGAAARDSATFAECLCLVSCSRHRDKAAQQLLPRPSRPLK